VPVIRVTQVAFSLVGFLPQIYDPRPTPSIDRQRSDGTMSLGDPRCNCIVDITGSDMTHYCHGRSTGSLVAAGRVMTGTQQLTPGWVEIRDRRIVGVGTGDPPRPADDSFPAHTVAPGFVDTHVHGGGGAAFSTDNAEDALHVIRTHLGHGTTSLVAGLVTAPIADLRRQTAVLSELVQQGDLMGIHLEGPWLNPAFAGAHDVGSLSSPAARELTGLLEAGKGAIRMVTLAPELDHGLDAVRRITGNGAVAAIGHTAADYQTTRAAIDAGVTVATHLFNAMPAVHHRNPGPVIALLEDHRVSVELIVDDIHLHPGVAAFAMQTAAGGFHLVTDAMPAAGGSDGRYRLGDREVDVRRGLATVAGTDILAGSTLTLDAAIRRSARSGTSLQTAVQAATVVPATRLGIPDVGRLAEGFKADLVVLDEGLRAYQVMKDGRWQ
jgi:N-acetylglucosamine-6-phosphate deacetylase